jgi:glycine betaine/choline ABC-type transport system substrate-binding protein
MRLVEHILHRVHAFVVLRRVCSASNSPLHKSNHEFYDRADGLRPLERAYGFEFGRNQVVRLDTNMIYQVMHNLQNVDVGLVFATDGRVAAYDLQLLTDDRGLPRPPTVLTWRNATRRAFAPA